MVSGAKLLLWRLWQTFSPPLKGLILGVYLTTAPAVGLCLKTSRQSHPRGKAGLRPLYLPGYLPWSLQVSSVKGPWGVGLLSGRGPVTTGPLLWDFCWGLPLLRLVKTPLVGVPQSPCPRSPWHQRQWQPSPPWKHVWKPRARGPGKARPYSQGNRTLGHPVPGLQGC